MSNVGYAFRVVLMPIPFLLGALLGFVARSFWYGVLDGWERA